jgi:hypothetical protein
MPGGSSDGSSDPRRVEGRRTFYQRAIETWLHEDGNVVSVRGIEPVQAVTTAIVATFDAEVLSFEQGPEWTGRVLGPLQSLGLSGAPFDGSAERAAFSASSDPAVAYARRFAPDSSMVLWVRADLREAFADALSPRTLLARLERAGLLVMPLSPAEASALRSQCGAEVSAGCSPWLSRSDCDAEAMLQRVQRYQDTRNPLLLADIRDRGGACGVMVVHAPDASVWLTFASVAIAGQQDHYWFPLTREPWAATPRKVGLEQLQATQWLPLVPMIAGAR